MFFELKDRSELELEDPVSGLEHKYVTANGLRCAYAHATSS